MDEMTHLLLLQALPYVCLLIAMLFFIYAIIGMQVRQTCPCVSLWHGWGHQHVPSIAHRSEPCACLSLLHPLTVPARR